MGLMCQFGFSTTLCEGKQMNSEGNESSHKYLFNFLKFLSNQCLFEHLLSDRPGGAIYGLQVK